MASCPVDSWAAVFLPITTGAVSVREACLLHFLWPAGKKDTRYKFMSEKANGKNSDFSITQFLLLGIKVIWGFASLLLGTWDGIKD